MPKKSTKPLAIPLATRLLRRSLVMWTGQKRVTTSFPTGSVRKGRVRTSMETYQQGCLLGECSASASTRERGHATDVRCNVDMRLLAYGFTPRRLCKDERDIRRIDFPSIVSGDIVASHFRITQARPRRACVWEGTNDTDLATILLEGLRCGCAGCGCAGWAASTNIPSWPGGVSVILSGLYLLFDIGREPSGIFFLNMSLSPIMAGDFSSAQG